MIKHAVLVDSKRCRGCTTCIKTCPTEAIRVRDGKAFIIDQRCIDCGRCIRACPHKAIKSVGDQLSRLEEFDFCVAVPDPALYAQFQNLTDINLVLNGLLQIGFQKVYEAARGAELLSDLAQQEHARHVERPTPQISSGCPTVLRLVSSRFPGLIGHISDTILPMELAAILARREASSETGLPPERIGVFAIVPCSAKATAARDPVGLETPVLDGAFAIRDIYLRLLSPMRDLCQEGAPPLRHLVSSGMTGVGWANCGGEGAARHSERCVAVDGVDNVIRMLGEIEDDRIHGVDFVEMSACTQGCLGGCFTVENPYSARLRLKDLMHNLPVLQNRYLFHGADRTIAKFQRKIKYMPTYVLDEDREVAMAKQREIQRIVSQLPGLHCGSCGAPSCHALAEDVVRGRATEADCVFKMRAKIQHMAGLGGLDEYLPAPFRSCGTVPDQEK